MARDHPRPTAKERNDLLEAVGGGQTGMAGPGPLNGRGSGVAIDHGRDFQPATSINSFSLPPSASQLVAKACRS